MGLFDDLNRFLESRLDEFLRANPHLELMGLEDQLRGQEQDAIALLGNLKRRQKQLEDAILTTAQEIQTWHSRIQKARVANRLDLLQGAEQREAALLRQGNQYWGQMQGVKQQIEQTRELQQQIHARRRELKTKIAQVQAERVAQRSTNFDAGWKGSDYIADKTTMDPLEEAFQRWEMDQDLEDLKRQVNRP